MSLALAPVSQLTFIDTEKYPFNLLFCTVCVNDNLRALHVFLFNNKLYVPQTGGT